VVVRRLMGFIVVLGVLAAAGGVRAAGTEPSTEPAVPGSFMRFVDDGHGGGSLQTADVAFRNGAGVNVHLVAAIHIAEKSYYDSLNSDFRGYDAVLYEMVKPHDMAPPAPGQAIKSDNAISDFQRLLKDSLELDFQLDDVDYSAANFVHADLDRETFDRLQEQRGESFESLMMTELMNGLNQPDKAATNPDEESMEDLVKVLTKPDMERQIKVVLAKQMGEMDNTAMGLDGPQGTVIVTERNKAAMATLDATVAGGKKNIAIFYGAAHMNDLSKRLMAEGFEPVSTNWRMAWDLTIRADQPSGVEKLIDGIFDSIKSKN
jgi:hypothetical protein